MTENYPAATPHGPLIPIMEDVWFVTGSVMLKPLLRLPRNMVVVRHEGELTLINSVRLDAQGEEALKALGKIAHVMKIGFHGMDDAYYLDTFRATHWVVDSSITSSKGPIQVLSEDAELPFSPARVFMFKDTNLPEAAILLEREGGLLMTCDSVQHWAPSEFFSPLARVATRFMGFQKSAQIGPPWRKKQTPAGGSLRADFERLASLKFEKLIGGHGGLLSRDAPKVLSESIARELG